MSQPAGARTESMSGDRAPRIAAAPTPRIGGSPVSRSEATARPATAWERGSMCARVFVSVVSGGLQTSGSAGILLGVPVAVEVVPVARVRADADVQLIGELLRGALDRGVARQVGRDDDRLAGRHQEALRTAPLDEARQHRG